MSQPRTPLPPVETISIRLLQAYGDDRPPLVIVDEGQDFDTLFAQWCQQDDAYCEGVISDRDWLNAEDFLRCRGVVVLDPISFDQLADFY